MTKIQIPAFSELIKIFIIIDVSCEHYVRIGNIFDKVKTSLTIHSFFFFPQCVLCLLCYSCCCQDIIISLIFPYHWTTKPVAHLTDYDLETSLQRYLPYFISNTTRTRKISRHDFLQLEFLIESPSSARRSSVPHMQSHIASILSYIAAVLIPL